jgi:hypothetical protein
VNEFVKEVGKEIRRVQQEYEKAPERESLDKSVREQVVADLDKLATRRESGQLN